MGYDTKASDWEVAGIGTIAGGAGVAGGVFFFLFQSASANINLGCRFVGLGMGVGIDLAKIGKTAKLLTNAPKMEKLFKIAAYGSYSGISYGKIECDRAFSLNDLHNSPGRVTMAGAAPAYGYTMMYITSATGIISANFASQPCHGWGVGLGASAMGTLGMWFNRA